MPETPEQLADLVRGAVADVMATGQPGYLSVSGAAAYLGVSPRTFHKMRKARGNLRAFRFGGDSAGTGSPYYRREELDAWAEGDRKSVV